MGTLIKFPEQKDIQKPKSRGSMHSRKARLNKKLEEKAVSADLLFFTGVRYERYTPKSEKSGT